MLNWPENARQDIRIRVIRSMDRAIETGQLLLKELPDFLVETSRKKGRGDFAVNAPLVVSSKTGTEADLVGAILLKGLELETSYIDHVQYKAPGFLNFTMKKTWYTDALQMIESDHELPISSEDGEMVEEGHPLFYAQYTYIRVSELLRRGPFRDIEIPDLANINFDLLDQPEELVLIRRLMDFPDGKKWLGSSYEFRFYRFVRDLAKGLQGLSFWRKLRKMDEDLLIPRLVLCRAATKVLGLSLDCAGIGGAKSL
jgi:arginyl-tRNA synthetase